jgi:hypothetical protein
MLTRYEPTGPRDVTVSDGRKIDRWQCDSGSAHWHISTDGIRKGTLAAGAVGLSRTQARGTQRHHVRAEGRRTLGRPRRRRVDSIEIISMAWKLRFPPKRSTICDRSKWRRNCWWLSSLSLERVWNERNWWLITWTRTSRRTQLRVFSDCEVCKVWGFHGGDYEECHLLGYKNPVRTSQETHYVSTTESSQLMLCKISSFHGSDYEECRLLGYKNPVRTSQETHYVSATESSRLMLCKIWGFHGSDYEECRLLGCKVVWLL